MLLPTNQIFFFMCLCNIYGPAEGSAELSWPRCHAVVIGVARGLLYLHEDAPVHIIHRDIKVDNILLDDRWIPKIGDFGTARLFPESGGCTVKTRPAGTCGYMAPEYQVPGSSCLDLSTKADVYSFGIVVLETISGKRNFGFIASTSDAEGDTLYEHVCFLPLPSTLYRSKYISINIALRKWET